MQRTKNILTAELVASVAAALLIVVLFETGLMVPGGLFGNGSAVFVAALVMEMITVCFIPLSLYMFKIGKVHGILTKDGDKAGRLLRWGSLRMMMLCLPMVLDTLFYYVFGLAVSFGYMAVIFFLCLFMVYPSMGRCISETSDETNTQQQ